MGKIMCIIIMVDYILLALLDYFQPRESLGRARKFSRHASALCSASSSSRQIWSSTLACVNKQLLFRQLETDWPWYYGTGAVFGKIMCIIIMVDYILLALLDYFQPRESRLVDTRRHFVLPAALRGKSEVAL
jgi:hypothetical protein